MKRLFFLLAIAASTIVLGAGTTATLTWIPPTQFTDGTPLTGVIGYRIDAKPKNYAGSTLTKTIASNLTTATFAGLICGDYDFTMYTLAGTPSDPSNTAPYKTEVTCSNKPNPPTGVTAS